MNNIKICTICNLESEGPFCHKCGQKIGLKETTLVLLIKDFILNAIDIERSLFASVFKIIRTPNVLIDNYHGGGRNYYPSPARLFFYALAVAILHLTYVDSYTLGINFNSNQLETHLILWVLILPLLTIQSYLVFLPKKIAFTKNVISLIYISSVAFIVITIISDITLVFNRAEYNLWQFPLFLTFIFIWNARALTIKKNISIILINSILQIIVFILLILILIFGVQMVFPDAFILLPSEELIL